MNSKVKTVLESYFNLSAKDQTMVAEVVSAGPAVQKVVQGALGEQAPGGSTKVVEKSTPKKTVKKRSTKAPTDFPPEILEKTGKDLIYEAARFKADGKGRTSRQAVQLPLARKHHRPEAEKESFKAFVTALEEEGKIKTSGNKWKILEN